MKQKSKIKYRGNRLENTLCWYHLNSGPIRSWFAKLLLDIFFGW